MNEEVKADVIKRTQDLLGKYIKKPPLTEKLLKKPPFRFLHDIITSVINATGFLDGVLTSAEMNAQNIKDKESKIVYLQKIIDAVKEASGIPLTVRPNKIVAGHEPTKTNEFLQAIVKGIESQKGATGTTPAQLAKKGTATKTSSSSQLSKQGTTPKDKPSTTLKQTKPHQRNLSQDRIKAKDGDKKKLPTATSKANTSTVPKDNVSQSKSKNEVLNSTRQSVVPDVLGARLDLAVGQETEQEIIEPVDESIDSVHATDTEVALPQEVEVARPPSAHFRQRNLTTFRTSDVADKIGDVEPTITQTQPIPINQKEDTARVQNFGDDGDKVGETVPYRRPMSTRPPSARPASARPAAPRIRDRGEVSRVEEIRPASRQVNVITENDTINDVDADEFIIKTKPITREDQLVSELALQPAEEGKHGHLVDQILETQKDLGNSGAQSTTPNKEPHTKKTDIEWEGGRKRDRETVKQEVAKLRELIQKTARIVNPAGKRMEFVQEDVDTMNRDLETWTETIKQLTLQLQEEQRLTDQAVEPMKMQQAQLEEMIVEKRAQISALKATVLQNDKRIKKLLLGEVSN